MENLRNEMIEESGVRGIVHYVVRDCDGNIKIDFEKTNIVTTVGKGLISGLLIGTGTAASNVAIGLGTASFALTSTQLGSEYARDTATTSQVTTTTLSDTAQLVHQFTFTETKAVCESGVLNAAVTGTMVCAQTFSALNVVSGDQITMTWKLAFA